MTGQGLLPVRCARCDGVFYRYQRRSAGVRMEYCPRCSPAAQAAALAIMAPTPTPDVDMSNDWKP